MSNRVRGRGRLLADIEADILQLGDDRACRQGEVEAEVEAAHAELEAAAQLDRQVAVCEVCRRVRFAAQRAWRIDCRPPAN